MALARVTFDIDFTIDRLSKSRKAALGILAQRIGVLRPGLSAQDICKCFLARERLGSTAVGAGVAAPHTIFEQSCPPLVQITALKNGIDFDASDGTAVDLLLSVVGNRHDIRWLHLALPRLTKLANSPELAGSLRSAKDVPEIEAALAVVGIYSHRTLPKAA